MEERPKENRKNGKRNTFRNQNKTSHWPISHLPNVAFALKTDDSVTRTALILLAALTFTTATRRDASEIPLTTDM